jgi:hypothetical protein
MEVSTGMTEFHYSMFNQCKGQLYKITSKDSQNMSIEELLADFTLWDREVQPKYSVHLVDV